MKLDNVIAVRPGKMVYRDGDAAIKVFDEGYGKADVLNEALNQARVEDCGLFVPKVREVTKLDGKWAIVTDFIEGKTLARLMEEQPEKKDEYLDRFVRLQISMHEKQVPLLTKLKDKMNRKISLTGLDATTRYELHTRLEGMPKHTKLCHGDFNPSNVIVSGDGDYIIDWAHATQGNASADAARNVFTVFGLAGDITGADKYLDKFCALSDTAKQYVQKWIPIVAASQLVKGKPQEARIPAPLGDVVDYE